MVVQDAAKDCSLVMYSDADLGGCPLTARSTTGMMLQIEGPKGTRVPTHWWFSKRQRSTARSTAESEIVTMAEGLCSEGLPTLHALQVIMPESGWGLHVRVKTTRQ